MMAWQFDEDADHEEDAETKQDEGDSVEMDQAELKSPGCDLLIPKPQYLPQTIGEFPSRFLKSPEPSTPTAQQSPKPHR